MEEEEEEMKTEEQSSVSVSSHQLLDQLVYPPMMVQTFFTAALDVIEVFNNNSSLNY